MFFRIHTVLHNSHSHNCSRQQWCTINDFTLVLDCGKHTHGKYTLSIYIHIYVKEVHYWACFKRRMLHEPNAIQTIDG